MKWQAISKGRWRGWCAAAALTCSTLARADATTGTFSLSTTLSDPCAVFAVQTSPTTTRIVYGEPISFTIDGSSTAVFDVADGEDGDGDGGVNLKFHVEAHGHGVGQNSGIPYVFHANALLKANTSGDPLSPSFRFDGSFKMDARIIGQGNVASEGKIAQGAQDNAVVRFDVRVRMVGGTVTASSSNFTIECQGSPWTNLMTANVANTKTPVDRGFGDPWNKYAWSMEDFAGGMVIGTKNAWYDALHYIDPSDEVQQCIDTWNLPAPPMYLGMACLELLEPGLGADAGPAEIWRYDHTKKTWSEATLPTPPEPTVNAPDGGLAFPQGFRIMTTHDGQLYAGADLGSFITGVALDPERVGNWYFPGSELFVSTDGRTFSSIESCRQTELCRPWTYEPPPPPPPTTIDGPQPPALNQNPVNSSIRALASYNGKLYIGTFNLTGGQLWAYDPDGEPPDGDPALPAMWSKVATVPAAAVTDLRVFNGQLYVAVTGDVTGTYLYRLDMSTPAHLVPVLIAPPDPPLADRTNLGTLTLFTSSKNTLYVGTVDLVRGFMLETLRFDGEGNMIRTTITDDGFGNAGNAYAWSVAEVNGRVFVGTFNQDFADALPRGSAELWYSDDETNWRQMALPVGWGPWNYGIRTMDVGNKSLFLGSASNIIAPDLTLLGDGTALSPGAEVWTLRTTVAAPTGGKKK